MESLSLDSSNDTWLKLSKEAYQSSTSYVESNYFKKWQDNLKIFHSQHPSSSKYNSDAYRYRSRLFRPKTRSVVRKHEATAARAFFSNLDVVSVSPQDGDDPKEVASAIINKELLQYRLTKTIPWFTTLIGAFQDAMNTGLCVSFQYWKFKYRETEEEQDALDPETGEMVRAKVPVTEVYEDEPCIEIIPIENLRFSPSAQWNAVTETSPYLILKIPMFVYKVKEMASERVPEATRWHEPTDSELRAALDTGSNQNDQARRGDKQAPSPQQIPPLSEYDVVIVHLNIMDSDDGRVVYYTLKETKMLSDPVALKEMFFHGRVPITVGFCVMETHNPFPDGLVDLGKQLQTEANEIVNQRLDNVKLVLNKRWLVKRNMNVDTDSLLRNVPGGVTMVSNTASDGGDIREVTWQDVTSSSYQEQDRVNVDFDDLTGGGINSGSVMTNRKLNETVGGMKIMAQGANDLTEYTIRTFVETWVEEVLIQLMLLEQYYESDETILALAGKKAAPLYQKFGQDEITDELLIRELTLTVNVGMGATDPDARFQKFSMGIGMWNQWEATFPPDANREQIRKEFFGLLGYRDSSRFYTGEGDPRITALQQQIQQAMQENQMLQQQLMDGEKDRKSKEKIAQGNNVTQLLVAQSKGGETPETQMAELSAEIALKERELNAAIGMDREKLAAEIDVMRERLRIEKLRAAAQMKLEEERTYADITMKDQKTRAEISMKREQAKRQPKNSGKEAA